MKKHFLLIVLLTSTIWFSSCKKKGCTDSNATNYDYKAKEENGSCILPSKEIAGEFSGNYVCDSKPQQNIELSFSQVANNTGKVTIHFKKSLPINAFNGFDGIEGTIDKSSNLRFNYYFTNADGEHGIEIRGFYKNPNLLLQISSWWLPQFPQSGANYNCEINAVKI